MTTLKELVTKGNIANFVKYQNGNLIYRVNDFDFPVPIEDTGTGVFPKMIKAVTLMRWIRKHLTEMEKQNAK